MSKVTHLTCLKYKKKLSMFNPEDVQKLERIAEKINFINEITNDFGSIQSALKDKKSGKPSIMMHLLSMSEQFNRLKDNSSFDILSKFDKEDLKGSYDIRNFIAHDYEGVNLPIIEMVIRIKLPKIKAVVDDLLDIRGNCKK